MTSYQPVSGSGTVGELACGCQVDLDGIRQTGDWITCPDHGNPARLVSAIVALLDGLITAEPDVDSQ